MITRIKHSVILQLSLIAATVCATLLWYHYSRLQASTKTKPYKNLENAPSKVHHNPAQPAESQTNASDRTGYASTPDF